MVALENTESRFHAGMRCSLTTGPQEPISLSLLCVDGLPWSSTQNSPKTFFHSLLVKSCPDFWLIFSIPVQPPRDRHSLVYLLNATIVILNNDHNGNNFMLLKSKRSTNLSELKCIWVLICLYLLVWCWRNPECQSHLC